MRLYHRSRCQKNRIVQELKKMLLRKECKIQNIEELLNGIKDFTEGQKKLMVLEALSEFMEDVAWQQI
jgi:DNA helicase-2/ATP-dependent DNA helicase PcrA